MNWNPVCKALAYGLAWMKATRTRIMSVENFIVRSIDLRMTFEGKGGFHL